MKQMVSESQFYKDAKLFYPSEKVGDPEQIPSLTLEELHSLQSDLEDILKLVLEFHKARHNVLSDYFSDIAVEQPQATVLVTNHNLPEASTTPSGEIVVDVRVLQSMLRASLLTAYQVEVQLYRLQTGLEFSKHAFSPEEEAIAINTFLSKRVRFDQTPSRSIIDDLTIDEPLDPSENGPLDWFEMRGLINEFGDISRRYDAQQFFIIAHEVGHLVLGHFGSHPIRVTDIENDPVDDCSDRRAIERAADIYAIILIAISTPKNAMDDFLGLFGGTTMSAGVDVFFSYAYDYAGFEVGENTDSCLNYPTPDQRFAVINSIYETIRNRQIDTIIQGVERGS